MVNISTNSYSDDKKIDKTQMDTDVDMVANSDTRLATQKAVLAALNRHSFSQTSVARSFNSNFQPSTTRNVASSYTIDISATITLTTGQTGTVFLEISADGSTGWVELSRFTNGNTGSLTIGLNLTQTISGVLTGMIPANYYARLRTNGTAAFTYRSGQETTI